VKVSGEVQAQLVLRDRCSCISSVRGPNSIVEASTVYVEELEGNFTDKVLEQSENHASEDLPKVLLTTSLTEVYHQDTSS
jgi:hypothetical protein